VAWLLITVAKVVGAMLFFLPFLALVVFALPLSPVLAIERLGPWAALRRSFALARHGFGRCLAVVGLTVLTTTAVLGALLVPLVLAASVEGDWRRPVATMAQLAVGLLVTPTAAVTAALTYVDLRVRGEGLDLHHEVVRRTALARAGARG
jgi:hypothetical protein